jgi:hypothetical protein
MCDVKSKTLHFLYVARGSDFACQTRIYVVCFDLADGALSSLELIAASGRILVGYELATIWKENGRLLVSHRQQRHLKIHGPFLLDGL